MKRKNDNFLDYIPLVPDKISWSENDGIVTVDIRHRGFFPWIAQTFFKKPKVSHIKLDSYGSFIWHNIDGTNTVSSIANTVKTKYGADAEPLYDRLVKYFMILKNNGFITYKKERQT